MRKLAFVFLCIFLTTVFSRFAVAQLRHSRDWISFRVSSDTIAGINAIVFADSLRGYLSVAYVPDRSRPFVNYPRWYRTTDGGISWEKIAFHGLPSADTNFVGGQYSAPTPRSFFVGGTKLYFTLDGGNNWDTMTTTLLGNNSVLNLAQPFKMFSEKNGIGFRAWGGAVLQTSTGPRGFYPLAVDSLLAATLGKDDFQTQIFYPAGDFSSEKFGCLIVADPNLQDGRGLTSVETEDSGHSWQKYNTIFPRYQNDTLYGDCQFQAGTSNVWEFPHRSRYTHWGGWDYSYLKNHPAFNISYCYSSDFGKTWQYDTSFYLRSNQTFGVTPGNVWMLLLDSNYHGQFQPPVHTIAHSTDYGSTWDIDTISLNVPDIGLADARELTFIDPSSGWIGAMINYRPYVFKYSPSPKSNVAVEHQRLSSLPKLEKVFPNPCSNEVTIDCPQAVSLQKAEVFDCCGRHVDVPISVEGNTLTIDTHTLQSGVWLVEIAYTQGFGAAKFIVQK